MSVRSKPNREGDPPQRAAEPQRDGRELPEGDVKSRCPNTMTTCGAVFVPVGTPDNSPPFQRWETTRDDMKSPVWDERDSQSSRDDAPRTSAGYGETSFAPPGLLGVC